RRTPSVTCVRLSFEPRNESASEEESTPGSVNPDLQMPGLPKLDSARYTERRLFQWKGLDFPRRPGREWLAVCSPGGWSSRILAKLFAFLREVIMSLTRSFRVPSEGSSRADGEIRAAKVFMPARVSEGKIGATRGSGKPKKRNDAGAFIAYEV